MNLQFISWDDLNAIKENLSESIGWNIYSGLPALRYYLQQDLGEGS